jgi:hypothetical protein
VKQTKHSVFVINTHIVRHMFVIAVYEKLDVVLQEWHTDQNVGVNNFPSKHFAKRFKSTRRNTNISVHDGASIKVQNKLQGKNTRK